MPVFAAAVTDSPVAQVLQLVGALMVLAGFVAVQRGLFGVDSRLYLTINLIGSGLLATLAAIGEQYGFLLLNVVWALVSLASLLRRPPTAT